MNDKVVVDKQELLALLERIVSSKVDFEIYGMARQLLSKLYEE